MNECNSKPPLTTSDKPGGVTPDPLTGAEADASKPTPVQMLREVLRWKHKNGLSERTLSQASCVDFHLKVMYLFNQIHEAFAGQTFIKSLPPDAPLNMHRFKTYVAYLKEAGDMLELAEHLRRLVSPVSGERRKPQRRSRNKALKSRRC